MLEINILDTQLKIKIPIILLEIKYRKCGLVIHTLAWQKFEIIIVTFPLLLRNISATPCMWIPDPHVKLGKLRARSTAR